jgi:hypothetical protein
MSAAPKIVESAEDRARRAQIMSPVPSPEASPSPATPATPSPVVSPNPSSASSETYSQYEARIDRETDAEHPGQMTDEDRAKLHGEYGISPMETPRPLALRDESSSSMDTDSIVSPSPLSELSFPEAPTHDAYLNSDFPEVPTHIASFNKKRPQKRMPFRRGTKYDYASDINSTSSSVDTAHAIGEFGESPPSESDVDANNDYYRRFLEFHENPTMSRTRRPFAKGRRRTHKCKPCKRRRPCKKTMKRRRRTYKKHRRRSYKKRRNSYKKRR